MFEINDSLVCINDKPLEGSLEAKEHSYTFDDIYGPPVINGNNYTAEIIHVCKCNKQHIGVGLELKIGYVRCFDCGEVLPNTTHWCHPSRFEKA